MSYSFAEDLLQWYHIEKRDLPWRQTSDPYRILISEIMLQQTRVDTVIPYYRRFLEAFPSVGDLARAERQAVLKLWEGLGYYSRCRNLHDAAKTIVTQFDGRVPSSYGDITSLKGIGPYTAAAVLSIAFQKKYAVVDGNVIRVLARFYGITDDIRSASVKKTIQNYADSLIPDKNPGDFNQSIMELGATICKPRQPECSACPVSAECIAANTARTKEIPYKSSGKKIPHHQIAVGMIVNSRGELLIALRPDDAMLGGLWEFPGGKKEKDETLEEAVRRELKEELGVDVRVLKKFKTLKHAYSHFKITLHAFWCTIAEGTPEPKSSVELKWVAPAQLDEYPFPKANKMLIEDLSGMPNQRLEKYLND